MHPFLRSKKMNCNCDCSADNTTIRFIRGTSCNLLFKFNVKELSSFEGVNFTIRKDYNTTPVIDKTITTIIAKEMICFFLLII